MRKTLPILLFVSFVYLFLLSKTGMAQQLGSRTELFTIENGLSQSGVNCILPDSRGYLWIGTQDGLDRYDGNTFTIFRHQPTDSNSICDNYIRQICEDHLGNLWLATNYGLSKYVPSSGIFVNYLNNQADPNSISSNSLYSVLEDKHGILWVKTLESLEKFDVEKNKFTHYYHYNNVFNYISGDFYCKIFEDSSEKLWIGTKDGLNCFDKNLELFEHFENKPGDKNTLSDNRVKVINEDAYGNIWVGTDNGLNKYNKTLHRFVQYFNVPLNNKSLINNVVNEIYVDAHKTIWIGTQSGISLYNATDNNFEQFSYLYCRNSKFALSGVSSIKIDNAHILWMGTYLGLMKVDLKPYKFGLFRRGGGILETNDGYNVASIMVDENFIWIGTWGEGLIKYHIKSGKQERYSTITNGNILKNDNIFRIYDDSVKYIWIGTENGITLYDKKNNSFRLLDNFIDCSFLEYNRVFDIHKDNKNWYWICTEHGLHRVNVDARKSETFIQIPDSMGVIIHTAYCITEDKDGFFWIGTDKGLIRYNSESLKYNIYLPNNKKGSTSLASNSVYSLFCSSKNDIWVGTTSGLCRYNRQDDDFQVFTEKEGLPNNLIYSIEEDSKGNLWTSTNRGLVNYSIAQDAFIDFDLADGLQSYEYNLGSSCKSPTGLLYFGGIGGFNYFNPDSLPVSISKPAIEITSIELFSGGKRSRIIPTPEKNIIISSTVNMFTVSFALLDFTYPQNNTYMYMLTAKGKEGLWVKNGNTNTVTFSNLPAGEYMFKVKGANSDQVLGDKEYVVYFIVETPIWKRNWAVTLYLLFIFGTIYCIIHFRTRKLRITNKELMDKEQAALEISNQKEELTIKNKNITDSINYAKRIQVAMMPSEKVFKRILPNSFVYHKPKDIVSGDFYWIYERNHKVFVAAVDCTGHGVPGAFMSILGVELFRKITLNQFEDPGMILSQLNDDFSRIFNDIEDISLKDGMDIAFCVIDKDNLKLQFSGAFNPLYLIRDNKITEIKGDRFSVSMEQKSEQLVFNTHTVELQKEDVFYIFSDGYADQFGGYEGKKFKYRRFRHLLLNIHKLPLEAQKTYLDESMDAWRGNHEQVDDLLVIGISANFQ